MKNFNTYTSPTTNRETELVDFTGNDVSLGMFKKMVEQADDMVQKSKTYDADIKIKFEKSYGEFKRGDFMIQYIPSPYRVTGRIYFWTRLSNMECDTQSFELKLDEMTETQWKGLHSKVAGAKRWINNQIEKGPFSKSYVEDKLEMTADDINREVEQGWESMLTR